MREKADRHSTHTMRDEPLRTKTVGSSTGNIKYGATHAMNGTVTGSPCIARGKILTKPG